MDISHFELLFKPQSPADNIGGGPVARVVQGYFLEITNLEDEEFRFAVNFIAPEPDPATPNAAFRSLSGNTLVLVDVPSADNTQGILNGSNKVYFPSTGLVRIPPEATALVAVLPSVFPSPLDPTPITTPVFEVRGFVRLRLPAVRSTVGSGPFSFLFAAQSDEPVKVMVTAQNRTTYFDASGAITDQTQASVPICAGKACIEIPPEEPLRLLDEFELELIRRPFADRMMLSGETERVSSELAAMLAAMDAKNSDLDGFNSALEKAEIPFKLERRGKRKK